MNLAEALNAALPDLPARRAREGHPKLDPSLIASENIEDGKPVVVALIRGTNEVFRFQPEHWRIAELFDGTRSPEEVAKICGSLYGISYSGEDVREFANSLEAMGFWYKTLLEKNIALQQKLEAGRHQHANRKSKWGDISHMQFSAWDPDRYFDRIYPYLRWVYTPWFGAVCAVLFGFMTYVFIASWGQIGQDTLQFYNFTQKSAGDLAEFWVLFLILGYFHESAHGLTCKHYGGQVHAMGFHLIYLTPAFFVDVTETLVYANRWQRLITILAGVWVEMVFCAVATLVWWGTPAGSGAHDLAYKIMLITGVAVIVVNMNPLIKLDGYFAFSEILGFSDIKEKSTSYVSGLHRKYIFGLPVEVDYVPKRRRAGFVVYALLSGAYSYLLLIAVIRFCDHVFAKYSPQWAFLPALALALVIFRSRLRKLARFMQTVYLDKRDRVHAFLTPMRAGAMAAVVLIVVLAPLWHETMTARYLLEPVRLAVVRTTVPGRVMAVLAQEGQSVQAGDALVRMSNAEVDSARAVSGKEFALTNMKRVQAQLTHGDLRSMIEEQARAATEADIAREQSDALYPRAPIDGVVTTARLADLTGSYLSAGTKITDIADTRQMRARVFIPEFAVGRVRPGARASLLTDGSFSARGGLVEGIEPIAGQIPEGLMSTEQIKGAVGLEYYIADVVVPNDGRLRDGMSGTAKIVVRRTSLLRLAATAIRDFVQRKIW
jgi:putative peptide zinc metalloprotease protein